MNGAEVRNVKFSSGVYDASQVDDLLERIAAELDAGRPAGPLIANATFQQRLFRRGYDSDAVDWFLDQLRHREDQSEAARATADPWRDLPTEPYYIRREPGDPAGRITEPSPQEYADAWRDFGQQPGTRLSWVRTGTMRRELRTADQQTVVSFRYAAIAANWPSPTSIVGNHRLSTGGRTFTLKRVTVYEWPDIAKAISRDRLGAARYLQRQTDDKDPFLRQLLDDTGIAVLYRGGKHIERHARSYIKFPGQRWLRFPVRGTKRANAIMTALNQAGNKVARYRFADSRKTIEIAVHPDHRLTEELALTIAVSAPWIGDYFSREGGGG